MQSCPLGFYPLPNPTDKNSYFKISFLKGSHCIVRGNSEVLFVYDWEFSVEKIAKYLEKARIHQKNGTSLVSLETINCAAPTFLSKAFKEGTYVKIDLDRVLGEKTTVQNCCCPNICLFLWCGINRSAVLQDASPSHSVMSKDQVMKLPCAPFGF